MKQEILKHPNPQLKNKSIQIESLTDDVKNIIQDMRDTLKEYPSGVGLASPQIGKNVCIILVKDKIMINPVIIGTSSEMIWSHEGCLSVPGFYGDCSRFKTVFVKYMNENWEEETLDAEGKDAIIIQHEIDHLNGIEFVEKLNRQGRREFKKYGR